MGTNFLIDTNTAIYFLKDLLPPKGMAFVESVVNSKSQISVITEIELLGFDGTASEMEILKGFVQDSAVFSLERVIVERTILLRKAQKIKLPDAIIAATALVHDLTLITRNTSDFSKIAGLKTIDPHSI